MASDSGIKNVEDIVSKILRVLREDSIKMNVIMTLISEEMASLRLLTRRLRVNGKKLKNNLKPLLYYGIIEEVQLKVSDGRIYRAYRLKNEVKEVLQKLLKEVS